MTQLVASKTANAQLQSDLKQERDNYKDSQKILFEEKKLRFEMEIENQRNLVEMEQAHQNKVGPHQQLS